MNAIPTCELVLSPAEKQIVRELLERENTSLPVEIHHTRTATFRDQLKARLKIIGDLLSRLPAEQSR